MPLAQIKGINGYLSLQQKQEIISKVTDAIVSAITPASPKAPTVGVLDCCSRRNSTSPIHGVVPPA